MKHNHNNTVTWAFGLCALAMAAFLWGCPPDDPTTQPPPASFELQRTAVPPSVFSIHGEAVAVRALGEPGAAGEVRLSVQDLRERVGGFNQVKLYEVDGEEVLGSRQLAVDDAGAITFSATAGKDYLAFAELGERHANSYQVLCELGLAEFDFSPQFVPRICTQILCTRDAYPASELALRVPELGEVYGEGGRPLPRGPVGGVGGAGNVCAQCLKSGRSRTFYPAKGCDARIPRIGGSPDKPKPGDPKPIPGKTGADIVYVFEPRPFNAPAGNPQIYKMRPDGSRVNLSNNRHSDYSPDVHHTDGKIVFASSRPGTDRLYTMTAGGGHVTAIPGTAAAGDPKWSRDPKNPFVVFTYPSSHQGAAIYRVRRDGTGRAQITHPSPQQTDELADIIDDQHILFSRLDEANNFDRDLFVKSIWDARPPQRLTNTPHQSETLPVVAHFAKLVAYRVSFGSNRDDEVHVAEIVNGALKVKHTIDLALPATVNISGIDFSIDDKSLYISTQANDVAGTLINRFQEVFCVRLDGSGQQRLTTNNDLDVYPSAVPFTR